jgi:predicted transcriptional regulator of viral defense system
MCTISSVNRKSIIPDREGLPSVFTYSKARSVGMSAERLYAYRNEGLIDQIGRGLFRWADAPQIDQDLLAAAYRVPRATLCLGTALARHGLSDAIPDRIDIAIPRGDRVAALRPVVAIHVFAKKTFDLGRDDIVVGDGISIGLYSPERSLVDVIRLRHREGVDVAWEALRQWLRRKGSKPATLLGMAKQFHGAESAVRNALDIVL